MPPSTSAHIRSWHSSMSKRTFKTSRWKDSWVSHGCVTDTFATLTVIIEYMSTQREVLHNALGKWPDVPPLPVLPVADTEWKDRKVDPIPGIFQQIAAIAGATVPPAASEVPPQSESSSSDDSSSGGESEESREVSNRNNLELEANTGGATFHTS